MSELLDQVVQGPAVETGSAEPAQSPSAGALLRTAREAAGLHIAALAVALKVPVKKLEALESDRLDLLPDAVFVRGLASSVCRALKIDAVPVLSQLPQTAVPRLTPNESELNTPFRAPGDVTRMSISEQLSKPGLLIALVFVVGALVLIFLPPMESGGKDAGGKTSSEVVEPMPLAQPNPPANPVPVVPAVNVEAATDRASTAPAVAVLNAPVVVSQPAPVAAAQVVAVAGAVMTPSPPSPAASNGLLVFKTRGASWVEVTDSQGVVQLRRLLASGETVGVAGSLPLSVVVGRADTMEVLVRGKPMSLEAVTHENVARFEVK